ncbi:MAG: 5-formyltetrahydrofolate cyclo-ligase [Xanthomonadales bacterium]|nr:5-formyltetrahydrofolate cyclo-ligase [Xanthomonadales bacterium]
MTPAARAAAADTTATHALTEPRVLAARHVALYRPVGAELDPLPLARALAARGVTLYWPKLVDTQMQFIAADLDAPTAPNRHGIAEPVDGAVIAPERLELVIVPLVGYGDQGQRLGAGAGWYDRSFAFRLQQPAPPWLAGYAYSGQRCALSAAPWDVPMDFVLTEAGVHDAMAARTGASSATLHATEPGG